MRMLERFLVAGLLVIPGQAFGQQADPSGHWVGSISAPFGEIPIALDIAMQEGHPVATYSRLDGSISGFPLSDVTVAANEVKLSLKASGGGVFSASFTPTSMTGTFAAFAGVVPFGLTRTGEPHFDAAPISAAITRALEGTWAGQFAVGGEEIRLRMVLANRDDGASTGTIADDHGIDVPVRIRQDGASVTIDIPSAAASFAGTLNAAGTELAGTYTEKAVKAPLTFTREQ